MSVEPTAYLNGQYLPYDQLAIPVYDSGFVLGATVAEQIRTFGGAPFRVQTHLRRLERSLEIVDVDSGLSRREFAAVITRLAGDNHRLQDAEDDLGISVFVTPGSYPTLAPNDRHGPTVCCFTYPLPFSLFASTYTDGQHLAIVDVRQVPPFCWPTELKCRSRMHYYLADQQAKRKYGEARALLLDSDGFVNEASTANVIAYFPNEGLVSPPLAKVLPGISLAVVSELSSRLGLAWSNRDMTVGELRNAEEIYLTSTSSCILPVTALDDDSVGTGRPGPVFQRLLSAWNELVGMDIAAQAVRFASR